MDFTLKTYKQLLNALRNQGFSFLTFEQFISNSDKKVIVLRHDVDQLPGNSLEFAKIQAELEIKGTYYFRAVPGSWDEAVIREIAGLGHEIGYHYEDLAVARQKTKVKRQKLESDLHDMHDLHDYRRFEKELAEIAIHSFAENLAKLRELAPVKTICMHGSPMSRWDSRLLWKYYDYRDFGIIGEPYFDIDFTNRLYLTDTGRSWSGSKVSIRDKASRIRNPASGEERYYDWVVRPNAGSLMNMTSEGLEFQNRYKYHSTEAIIKAIEEKSFPVNAMITFHPQRWSNKVFPWMKELLVQTVKNSVKYFIVKINQKLNFG